MDDLVELEDVTHDVEGGALQGRYEDAHYM